MLAMVYFESLIVSAVITPHIQLKNITNKGVKTRKQKMAKHDALIFKPYPFEVGQKLHIDGGAPSRDWEVIDLSERKVKLCCPVSLRGFE